MVSFSYSPILQSDIFIECKLLISLIRAAICLEASSLRELSLTSKTSRYLQFYKLYNKETIPSLWIP